MRAHKRFNYVSSQFIEIIYTSEVAKIRKVFTKSLYLFDSVSMERLKSAVQSALTNRNLSIALKKEQMECVSSFVDRRDVLAVLPTGYLIWLYLRLTPKCMIKLRS